MYNEAKEYTMVLLKKGLKYHIFEADIRQQNYAAHNSYLAELKAAGLVAFWGAVTEGGDDYELIIFTIADKKIVKTLLDNDPGVAAEMFTYHIRSWLNVPDKTLA
jgi:hypothetical protein